MKNWKKWKFLIFLKYNAKKYRDKSIIKIKN
jgi:hypothetical protein